MGIPSKQQGSQALGAILVGCDRDTRVWEMVWVPHWERAWGRVSGSLFSATPEIRDGTEYREGGAQRAAGVPWSAVGALGLSAAHPRPKSLRGAMSTQRPGGGCRPGVLVRLAS